MTVLFDLIAALPAGAAEAVVSQGLDSLISRLRRAPNESTRLVEDLEAIRADTTPSRPMPEIVRDLSAFIKVETEIHRGPEIAQRADGQASQLAIGEVGGDLYLNHPLGPHRE